MTNRSDFGDIYEALSKEQEIFVMPVRMKEEKLRIPTDDESYALMVVDYFLEDSPFMLFAPRQIMEAWFYSTEQRPGKDLPLEVHVPGNLVSKHGGIPLLRMKFIKENEYAELVSEIQKGQVQTYMTK